MSEPRVGIGFDSHRFVDGRPLMLGGVRIPFDRGLAGHSDADAPVHALIDALLGAAGAGDIGLFFPDDDEAHRNASSLDLLDRVMEKVRERGYRVGNADLVVIAERPRIAPHASAMRAALAKRLGVEPESVSIKGKTAEGMGAIGAGEGIAAHAVVLLFPRG
ncbi:MAG: 2-C-methyl-D-erythritol 2,4-cyclodiphosphate synthase [Candidatus Eisenbacteria bacterium]|nr:2-C-methyl-D-erythritol 2,4-cyclodiphosphate synthase [Candidatus Eisenbacteria bacterium]